MPPKDTLVQIQKRELIDLVGDIETPGQIIIASHWLDGIQCDDASTVKDQAWMSHINQGKKRFFRIWDELSFYRIIGEPTAFIVPGWAPTDRGFDELCLLGERWVFLAAEGALWRLESHEWCRKVKQSGGSLAERLKVYLEVYRETEGVDEWTEQHMNNARFRVIRVYEEFLRAKGRPLFNSERQEDLPSASASIPNDDITQTVEESPTWTVEAFNAELGCLHALFGKITTDEEISLAAKYSDPVAQGHRGNLTKAAFEKYTRENCDFKRVHAEMDVYKLIGKCSTYFSMGEVDVLTIEELSYVVRDWFTLETRGLTKLLVDDVDADSVPARLKTYMVNYKIQKGFNKWNDYHLNYMRYNICQALIYSSREDHEARPEVLEHNSLKRSRDTTPTTPSPSKRFREAYTPTSMLSNLNLDDNTPAPRKSQRSSKGQMPIRFGDPLSAANQTPLTSKAAPIMSTPRSPLPANDKSCRTRVNELLRKHKDSEKTVHAAQKALDAARTRADTARQLIFTHTNEITDIAAQFVGGNQAQNLGYERIAAFLDRMSQLQMEIEQLREVVGRERAAKEVLDGVKGKHRVWERKMEALELVVDDPDVFEE